MTLWDLVLVIGTTVIILGFGALAVAVFRSLT